MQVDEKRACPRCTAENPAGAGFCWKCHQPFGAADAAPASSPQATNGQQGVPHAPGMPHGPGARPNGGRPGMPASVAPVAVAAPSAPAKSGGSLVVRVLIAIVAAAAGYLLVGQFFGGPSYEVPKSIGGESRMTGSAAEEFESQMNSLGDEYDVTVDSAMYGKGDTPSLALIVMSGEAIESTDALFTAFLDGMAASGVEIGRGDERTGDVDGDEFRCVPISGPDVRTSVCMWRGDDQMGMLLDLTHGVDDVQRTLRDAHRAVNA